MFNKNDPLIGSVKKVMELNETIRKAQEKVSAEFGVYSRAALPIELREQYDRRVDEVLNEDKTEVLEEGKIGEKVKKAVKKLKGEKDWVPKDGKPPKGSDWGNGPWGKVDEGEVKEFKPRPKPSMEKKKADVARFSKALDGKKHSPDETTDDEIKASEKKITDNREKKGKTAQVVKLQKEETIEEGGYSKSAVDKEIKKDKRIKGKEAKAIHALLRGRQKTDEPEEKKVQKESKDEQLKKVYDQIEKIFGKGGPLNNQTLERQRKSGETMKKRIEHDPEFAAYVERKNKKNKPVSEENIEEAKNIVSAYLQKRRLKKKLGAAAEKTAMAAHKEIDIKNRTIDIDKDSYDRLNDLGHRVMTVAGARKGTYLSGKKGKRYNLDISVNEEEQLNEGPRARALAAAFRDSVGVSPRDTALALGASTAVGMVAGVGAKGGLALGAGILGYDMLKQYKRNRKIQRGAADPNNPNREMDRLQGEVDGIIPSRKPFIGDKNSKKIYEEQLDEARRPKGKNWEQVHDEYLEREDNNAHTENALALAKHFGTPEEKDAMKRLHKEHMRRGALPMDMEKEVNMRHQIDKKYYPKLVELAEKDKADRIKRQADDSNKEEREAAIKNGQQDLPLKESVLQEITNNLLAQYNAIAEQKNQERIDAFVANLTEEQAALLEAGGAFGRAPTSLSPQQKVQAAQNSYVQSMAKAAASRPATQAVAGSNNPNAVVKGTGADPQAKSSIPFAKNVSQTARQNVANTSPAPRPATATTPTPAMTPSIASRQNVSQSGVARPVSAAPTRANVAPNGAVPNAAAVTKAKTVTGRPSTPVSNNNRPVVPNRNPGAVIKRPVRKPVQATSANQDFMSNMMRESLESTIRRTLKENNE